MYHYKPKLLLILSIKPKLIINGISMEVFPFSECKGKAILACNKIRSTNPQNFSTKLHHFRNI